TTKTRRHGEGPEGTLTGSTGSTGSESEGTRRWVQAFCTGSGVGPSCRILLILYILLDSSVPSPCLRVSVVQSCRKKETPDGIVSNRSGSGAAAADGGGGGAVGGGLPRAGRRPGDEPAAAARPVPAGDAAPDGGSAALSKRPRLQGVYHDRRAGTLPLHA